MAPVLRSGALPQVVSFGTQKLPSAISTPPTTWRRFHIYERDGVTAVFWQEGPTVCVLIGDGPPRDIVELAVGKAMAPA